MLEIHDGLHEWEGLHDTPASEPLGDDDLRECEDAVVAHYMGSPTAPETPTGAASEDVPSDPYRRHFCGVCDADWTDGHKCPPKVLVEGHHVGCGCFDCFDRFRPAQETWTTQTVTRAESDDRVAEAVREDRKEIAKWCGDLARYHAGKNPSRAAAYLEVAADVRSRGADTEKGNT